MVRMPKMRMKSNCTGMDTKLANLLLDPAAVSDKMQTHLDECDRCRRELGEMRATVALLDTWKTPEPNPYFLTRLQARLREEREAGPTGWLASLRARFAIQPVAHVRPLAAMALAVVLLVGGGAYLGITGWNQPPATLKQTAVVNDLQILESNAQLLDQLETLSSSDEESGD